jgi:hypothetical protein
VITEAMTPDEFMNTAVPWVFGVFIIFWVAAILVKIIRDTWKDD